MSLTSTNGAAGREAQRAEGERGEAAGGSAGPKAVPDPELTERPKRRAFSAEFKLAVLKEAEACEKQGEVGALLRREGLYSSHLSTWRRQREEGALGALGRDGGHEILPIGGHRISPLADAKRPQWRPSVLPIDD